MDGRITRTGMSVAISSSQVIYRKRLLVARSFQKIRHDDNERVLALRHLLDANCSCLEEREAARLDRSMYVVIRGHTKA